MDAEILQAFTEEAESYLPIIRGGILVCRQNGKFQDELSISLRQAHTIKGAAITVGLTEIGEIAEKLESELEEIVAARLPLTDEQSRHLLDKVAQIEALLVQTRFEKDDFSINAASVEELFENIQIKESPIEKSDEESEFEDFEIDDEMLEIFAAEAEDLLNSIGAHLKILEQSPDNREALLEIRRNAHTLKGSAGIIGLKKLSGLAHRVEDLLDFLSENEVAGSKEIFELLRAAADCLNALTSGDESIQLTKKIEQIETGFDEVLSALEKNKNKEKEKSQNNDLKIETPDEPNFKVQAAAAKSVVRVSLEKLDDLVSLVGEMVISRSMFERRLDELGKQIAELENNTRRLQRSTNKLETDFEKENILFTPNVSHALSPATSSSQFDALEFDRYTEFHQTTNDLIETTGDASSINLELEKLRSGLEVLFDRQRRLIEEMQDKLIRLRMVNFGSLSTRLHRTIRVTAEQEEKLAQLFIEGENVEVDTQILDTLVEPLLHLLRNAVAHGIEPPETRRLLGKPETGKISLTVRIEGMHIVLTVSDDGRGITALTLKEKAVQSNFISASEAETMTEDEALRLAFLPGLTTTEEINFVSGRGVGMNIVKTAIERQQGTVSIDSKMQQGATFTIRLPLSLAVTNALLVKSGGQNFAFPLNLVRHLTEIPAENLAESVTVNETTYSVLRLSDILDLPPASKLKSEKIQLLLIEILEKPYALVIDETLRAEEIIVKPLGSLFGSVACFIGATVLGDGSVVPVLDLVYLLKQASNAKEKGKTGFASILQPKTAFPRRSCVTVLIVDDSPSVRHINSKLIENAGMQPVTAKDGLEALEILQSSEALPDVILTDVEMPRMDGYELLASIKRQEKLRVIPVIMITSRSSEKHRQKAFELGVTDFLIKPYAESKLLEIVRRSGKIPA